jgi:hypothetical protein
MADYSAIYEVVRGKLRETVATLPNTDPALVLGTTLTVTALLENFPCVTGGTGDYANILTTQNTKFWFDATAGLLIAAKLRPDTLAAASAANGGQGAVIEERTGPDTTRWAGPTKAVEGVEPRWQDEAWSYLLRIACIKAARLAQAGRATGGMIGIDGYRRRIERHCGRGYGGRR